MKKLENEQLIPLIEQARKGSEESKDILYKQYHKAIRNIINRMNLDRNKYDHDDLFQIGCIGFLKAIEGFDSSFNCTFFTYLFHKVRGEVLRELRDKPQHSGPKIPRSICDEAIKFIGLSKETGEDIDRLINHSDLRTNVKLGILTYLYGTLSLNACNEGEDAEMIESIPSIDDFSYHVIENDFFGELDNFERIVYSNKYNNGLNQKTIAQLTGFSQGHISRVDLKIKSKAIKYCEAIK